MIDPAALPIGSGESWLANVLPGTWRLTSWRALAADGSTVPGPFGEDADGLLVYTPDGTMITTIGWRDRPAIGGRDPAGGPDEARLAAAATFIAYAGAWRLEGGEVIHTVEMSLFPDWVGGEQRRSVEIADNGETLVLTSGPLAIDGIERRHRLAWRRLRR